MNQFQTLLPSIYMLVKINNVTQNRYKKLERLYTKIVIYCPFAAKPFPGNCAWVGIIHIHLGVAIYINIIPNFKWYFFCGVASPWSLSYVPIENFPPTFRHNFQSFFSRYLSGSLPACRVYFSSSLLPFSYSISILALYPATFQINI